MTLLPKDGNYQIQIDEDTGEQHLVYVDPADSTVTDIVTLSSSTSDPVSGVITTIDFVHQEIHAGRSFVITDVIAVNTTTQKWLITTPNTTRYSHMFINAEGTGEMLMTVTEAATHTGTTALTAINRNRVGTPTAAGTIIHRNVDTVSPVTSDGTTVIFTSRTGATGQGNKTIVVGDPHDDNEFILKPNTKYTIAVETFASIHVTLLLNWYEHIDVA